MTNTVTPTAGSAIIPDVPFYPQEHAETCETAALAMALQHQEITATQTELLNGETVDPRPGSIANGVLTWGDPYSTFVGSPDGDQASLTGFGTYYSTIQRVALSVGANLLSAGEDTSPQTVYDAVSAGHPVITWLNPNWKKDPPTAQWDCFDGRTTTEDGHPLYWYGGSEHALVVVGVSEDTIVVQSSAANGAWETYTKEQFEAGFAQFNGMAIVFQ